MIPYEWIFSHRCSWITVYVFCRNTQSEPHSDPRDVCMLFLLYQLLLCSTKPSSWGSQLGALTLHHQDGGGVDGDGSWSNSPSRQGAGTDFCPPKLFFDGGGAAELYLGKRRLF
jgi:hypothetical protein